MIRIKLCTYALVCVVIRDGFLHTQVLRKSFPPLPLLPDTLPVCVSNDCPVRILFLCDDSTPRNTRYRRSYI